MIRAFSFTACLLQLVMPGSATPWYAVTSATEPKVVCIDPGHPSENGVGTRGKKMTEVHMAWLVAQRLKSELEDAGIKVVLTKERERQTVTNKRRAEIANEAEAALFVRLHCDSAVSSGLATYYPDRAVKLKDFTGPSKEVREASKLAASALHPEVIRVLDGKLKDRRLHTDRSTAIGGRQGALTGSIYAKVPVVLIEMCVLTNAHDEKFANSKDGPAQLAKAISAGVQKALAALEAK
jgi:N-acetylmuramoyl-L-alanine amidase